MSEEGNFDNSHCKDEQNDSENEGEIVFSLKFPGSMTHQENEEENNRITCSRVIKIIGFYLIGISCFIPYNAILSGLDCFIAYHPTYQPEFVYSTLFFLSNCSVQMLIIFISPKYSYYRLIQYSQVVSIICLLLNPFALQYLSNFSSFVASCVIVVIQGSSSAILFACLYSFLSYLDNVFITSVVTGHGLSGIIMNLVRLLTFFLFDINKGQSEDKNKLLDSFYFFYLIAASLIFVNIFIWINIKNQIDIRKAFRKIHPTLMMFDEEVDYEERCLSLCSLKSEELPSSIKIINIIENSEYKKVKEVLKIQFVVNIMLLLHGLITFSVYPGILIQNKLFFINESMSILIILFIFNIFDIIGRQFPKCYFLKKLKYIYIIISIRIYCIIYFISINIVKQNNMEYLSFIYDQYFISTNIALLAFTNGFVISNSFILIGNDTNIKEELKSKASPILSVSLNIGIYLGTIFAYLLNYIIY